MHDPQARRDEPQAHQRGRERAPLAASEPRAALQHADEPDERDRDGHARHGSAARWRAWPLVALAVLCAALPWTLHAAEASTGGGLTVPWAIALGALQGITEFLPISSDGHLALGQRALGLDPGAGGHQFTIIVHAGTLLAVIWTYRADLLALARSVLGRPDPATRRLLLGMIVASAPLGLVLLPGVEDFVIAMESQVRWIGVFLWVTGAALWLGFRHDRQHPPREPGQTPSLLQALVIGLAQVTAVLPGVSRSGMTISSSLLLGIDRNVAARFSFLISVIAVGGAVAKEGLDLLRHGAPESLALAPALAGFATSLVVGLVALQALLRLVARGAVLGFVVYLAVLGGIAVALGG